MGIEYPNGTDTFTVPSDPENTPLSSAGDGTRNLVESIDDLGLAATALEGTAAIKTHTHAGGADGTQILQQAHTHANPDTDLAVTSIHHTIGPTGTQAAAGNHTHDYDGTSIYNQPYEICTSTTRPADPKLGMRIWETDTNCERIWAGFPGNTLTSGIHFEDGFARLVQGVNFDSVGAGNAELATNSIVATHEFGPNVTGALAAVTVYDGLAGSAQNWTVTCDIGTTPMVLLGTQDTAGSLTGFVALFGLADGVPGAGSEVSFTVNATNPQNPSYTANISIETVAYNNLGAFGPVVKGASLLGVGLEAQVPSSPGEVVFAANVGALGAITAPTGTQRAYSWPSISYDSLLINEMPGAFGTVTIGAWNQSVAGGIIAVNLIPLHCDLGPGYTQTYLTGTGPGGGGLGTPVSGAASWLLGQNVDCRVIEVPVSNGITDSDDQDFKFTTGTAFPSILQPKSPTVDIYARRSADGQTYVRLALSSYGAELYYTSTGPTGEQPLGTLTSVGTQSPNINWEFKVKGNQFLLYRGGVQVASIIDQQNLTHIGAAYRGWTWGASAVSGTPSGLSNQIIPATVTGLEVDDLPIYETELIWQLLPTGNKPRLRAECHVGQEITVNNTISAFFDTVLEDLWGMFGAGTIGVQTTIPPATDIVIPESGHYDVNISIPWDPDYYTFDHATLGFTVNGQDVGRKVVQFLRGNGNAPGIPQTMILTTDWYFAAGDVMRVVVSNNATTQSWLFYNGSPGSKQTAWVNLKFDGP